jgi:integrase
MELISGDDHFVFPSRSKMDDAVTRNALSVAMRRFSDQLKDKSAATKTWRADPPSPHDLRRTFATRLSGLGVSKEDRDALLNHIRSDVGSKHYDLYERAKEKRVALSKWHDALTAVLNGAGAEVAGFKKAARSR